MGKFNLYQIPINKADSYVYYNDDTKQLVDIEKENDVKYDNADMKESLTPPQKEGSINGYNLNQYDEMIKQYRNNMLPTSQENYNEEFKNLKQRSLPPSLYNVLGLFYEYSMKLLIENIIDMIITKKDAINSKEKQIFDKMNVLIKNINLSIGEYDLSGYMMMAKVIQELMIDQINVYIDNKTVQFYEDIKNNQIIQVINQIKSNVQSADQRPVHLQNTNVDIDKLVKSTKKDLTNLYPLMTELDKPNNFILYPNDFTNLKRLKSKYGISKINRNVIEILLKHNASPFIANLEGYSSIYPVILNSNYETIKDLKNLGIDFRTFEKEQPIKFMKNQITTNIDRMLGNIVQPMKETFNNICSYLHADVKGMILSNEAYGNNILLHLEDSFYMSTYLTLQFLSEHLLDTDTDWTPTVQKQARTNNISVLTSDPCFEAMMLRMIGVTPEIDSKKLKKQFEPYVNGDGTIQENYATNFNPDVLKKKAIY